MKDEDTILERMALSRKTVVELLLIAIVLSFGINLLASLFLNWAGENVIILLSVAIICCLVPLIYGGINFFGDRKKSLRLEGFIAYNPIKKELICVDRYDFSEQLTEYIEAGCTNNTALKSLWEKQPLEPYVVIIQNDDGSEEKANHEQLSACKFPIDGTLEGAFPPNGEIRMRFTPMKTKENMTVNLLCQATEYYLLDNFSNHLYQFFTKRKINRNQLTVYERNNAPSALLMNTFFKLFSYKDVDEAHDNKVERDFGEDYATNVSYGKGGGMYRKFYLILPKKSKVTRLKEHEIEIETGKIKIHFIVHMDGAAGPADFDFMHYYLGFTNLFDIAMFRIKIDILITVKKRAMLSINGWDYYDWVDSFLHNIEELVSEQEFFKTINWESTLTMIDCTKRIQHTLESKNIKNQE